MKRCFVDSNVIVYANDRRVRKKQKLAIELVARLMRARSGVISIQVMQEYANTALLKLRQESSVVIRQLRLLESLYVVSPTVQLVRRSVELRNAYGIGFWDAGIIAAAEAGECDIVLSEDFSEGQYYAGIQVVNPFKNDFDLDALFQ